MCIPKWKERRLTAFSVLCLATLLLLQYVLPLACSEAIDCIAQCKTQLDLIHESFTRQNGEKFVDYSSAEKCQRACSQPVSICENIAACQQDYACLVRCQGESTNNVRASTRKELQRFDVCTLTQLHPGSGGSFSLSSQAFWLPSKPIGSNSGTLKAASYQVDVRQRGYYGDCGATNTRKLNSVHTNTSSISLASFLDNENDCVGYKYDFTIHRADGQRSKALHNFGLCELETTLNTDEQMCLSDSRQSSCNKKCPPSKHSCKSGEASDILKTMSLGTSNIPIELFPEISVMRFNMRRVHVCSLSDLGVLRLNASVIWWPGYPGDQLYDCMLGHLPSCWCYSSCEVRFEAQIRIGNVESVVSFTTSDYNYLRGFETRDGPYYSDFLMDFPFNGTEDGFIDAPVLLSLRAHYSRDVFGKQRAKWSHRTLNNTCPKSNATSSQVTSIHRECKSANTRSFEGVLPRLRLLRFRPRSAGAEKGTTPSGSIVDSSINVFMSTVLNWQMEEPDDNAKTCFLGYDRCWCDSCCRVTVGMKLDRITDNGAVNFYSRVTYEPWDRAGTQLPATASQHSANWSSPVYVSNRTDHIVGQDCNGFDLDIKVDVQVSFGGSLPASSRSLAVRRRNWCQDLFNKSNDTPPPPNNSTTTIVVNSTASIHSSARPQVPATPAPSSVEIVLPLAVSLTLLALLLLGLIIRRSTSIRDSKILRQMARDRSDDFKEQSISRKSLSLVLRRGSHQTSASTLLSSPTKTEKVNYNYIPMDKLHEAASKGNWTCFPPQLEFPVDQLDLERQIGTGQFGCVWMAKAYGIEEDIEWTHVAVKMLKDDSPQKDAEDFLTEAQHLSTFYHRNIVQLLGVVVHGTPKMVVLEYMDGGDLQAFLQARKVTSSLWKDGDFIDIALDVLAGLRYLESKKFVHRDVAARNCLVRLSASPTRKVRVTKLADFGLARNVHGNDCYTLVHKDALLPVRWMAPESITKAIFTHSSDVWSFGILMWELYTFGDMPYGECVLSHTVAARISNGATLPQPSNCPKRMFAIMKHCWSKNPKSRPSFSHLVAVMQSYKNGFARRSTKSTAITMSTLSSIGEYLASETGGPLDMMTAQSTTCPPIVFEDCDSISPSPDVTRCSCHTTSTSVFERSPRQQRRNRSSKSTAITIGTAGSLGDYLASDSGGGLDISMTRGSPSLDVTHCSCHTTSTSVFDPSPRHSRRSRPSGRLGEDTFLKCPTPVSLRSASTADNNSSVFNEESGETGDSNSDGN